MPIYEYKCKECDITFEVIEGLNEDRDRKCKECSGEATRVVSQSSFVLKGTGWYKTDYADKKPPDTSKGKKGSSPAKAGDAGKPSSSDDCASCPASKG